MNQRLFHIEDIPTFRAGGEVLTQEAWPLLDYLLILEFDPDDQNLFALLAAVFVRLDQAANYCDLIEHVRAIGEYARPELDQVASDETRFNDEMRRTIRDAALDLLEDMQVDGSKSP